MHIHVLSLFHKHDFVCIKKAMAMIMILYIHAEHFLKYYDINRMKL